MKNADDRGRVLGELRRFGYQSQSYHILGDDKSFFFSPSGVSGVIAYVVHAKVALGAGDPVCAPSDLPAFINEFSSFCRSRGWRCCFQAVTERCHDILVDLGFGAIKIGEEPIYDLRTISWDGGRFRGLRRDIRVGKKHGLVVVDYRPLSERRSDWETQMEELSATWEKFKGSGEFAFLLGEPSLSDPGERKYFLALLDDEVEAFVVCTPIYARNGIYFDLMRRKERPLSGTSQFLISESFRLLREQGYEMATLGTAPLSNQHVDDPTRSLIIGRALDLAYGRLGSFHRYKPIHEFKNQFGPTSWESRYLAYRPPGFNPIMLYALLKAYDPSGITGKLSRQIHHAWEGFRKRLTAPASVSREDVSTVLQELGRDIARRLQTAKTRGERGAGQVEGAVRKGVANAAHEIGGCGESMHEVSVKAVMCTIQFLVKAGAAGRENVAAVVRGVVEGAVDEEVRAIESARDAAPEAPEAMRDDDALLLERMRQVLEGAREAAEYFGSSVKEIIESSAREIGATPGVILKRVREARRATLHRNVK